MLPKFAMAEGNVKLLSVDLKAGARLQLLERLVVLAVVPRAVQDGL